METINPKNFIDIDPSSVSFITLKDGNMIMLDDSAPVKPTKENNNNNPSHNEEEINKTKDNNKQILAVSFPINFAYIGNIKKNTKLIISKNICFSYKNIPSPNSSIDFKSSMLQSKKDINNLNINNSTNIINKNVFSEDNVNIHMTDTLISKQTTININNENDNKKEEINIQAYTFKDNQDNENIIPSLLNNEDIDQKEEEIKNNKIEENNNTFKKIVFNNNKNKIPSSLIIQNNNYNIENEKRNIKTEANNEEKKDMNRTYNKIIKKNKEKNNNYVKAVISINIPGEEKKNSNIIKQFNSLVDRLNGQKSKERIKNVKKSDRFYELYKNSGDNNILNKILSPKKIKRKIPHDYFRDISSFLTNSEMSTVSSGKGSDLNSRILALKERTNPNNSFRSENDNNTNDKNDIVLPSNFVYAK